MNNEREIILEALGLILDEGRYFHIVMSGVLKKHAYLDVRQRAFIRRVTCGVVERLLYLDYCIDQFSKTPVRKMRPVIRNILRMGVYQILFMEQVPPSAAVNESVKLARKKGFSSLSGFVNAILRAVVKNKTDIVLPDEKKEPVKYLSVVCSMPEWITSMIMDMTGREGCERVLSAMLDERKLSIRISCMADDDERKKLALRIEESGARITPSGILPDAYYLEKSDDISRLPGFDEGLIYVQDIGAMMVVESADIKEGDTVVDICAAPGGKSIHAAQIMRGKGKVISRDLTEKKTDLIRENALRCGLSNIEVQTFDATVEDDLLKEKADVLIADLPCSGLGVIGRKPDIKYRVRPEDIAALQRLQRRILKASCGYVKPGGTLVYSTCTITRQENEDNRDWILENLPFEMISEKRLMPGIDETDGFYILKLKRKKD